MAGETTGINQEVKAAKRLEAWTALAAPFIFLILGCVPALAYQKIQRTSGPSTLTFKLSEPATGTLVRSFDDYEASAAGQLFQVDWDAKNNAAQDVGSGLYIFRATGRGAAANPPEPGEQRIVLNQSNLGVPAMSPYPGSAEPQLGPIETSTLFFFLPSPSPRSTFPRPSAISPAASSRSRAVPIARQKHAFASIKA